MLTVVHRFLIPSAAMVLVLAGSLQAQNIGWEGETGVFVTPLAYTAASPADGLGKPMVGYHFLSGGPVLGNFYEISGTAGAFGRLEFGYTRPFHTPGGNADFSSLWTNGFNIIHAKVNLVKENAGKNNWVPAISTGFIARSQVRNVGGVIQSKETVNGDVYIVATKIVPIKPIPIILNGGVRGTNAELWGMGGNADHWQPRAFGSIGFVVKLPKKASVIFATEVAQQPLHPDQLPTARIPTTFTYCFRLSPVPESKVNVDFGVAQIAGTIAPGVNLRARARIGMQVGYAF